jgi:hypothetical protein
MFGAESPTAISGSARSGLQTRFRIVVHQIENSMLALSLSIFAALVLSAVSAVARDVPAKLALPQGPRW